MPDRRQHRGPHPQDSRIFSGLRQSALQESVAELSWLLSRGYPDQAALKLVGDRHKLTTRQRKAVSRCACADEAGAGRRRRRVSASELSGEELAVDGFNCLITLESALSGAVVLRGRDGALRDMASVHGSYRRVKETPGAIEAIGRCLERLKIAGATFYLDRPVSNSGRLAFALRETAAERGWPWDVVLCANPDLPVSRTTGIAASSDSWILDRCERWVDVPALVMQHKPLREVAWIIDFSEPVEPAY
jgi:hypothetical protein